MEQDVGQIVACQSERNENGKGEGENPFREAKTE